MRLGTDAAWRTNRDAGADRLGTNLFDEKLRTYFQYPAATFTEYNPGRTWMLGFRVHF